jgi:hypothetical protein
MLASSGCEAIAWKSAVQPVLVTKSGTLSPVAPLGISHGQSSSTSGAAGDSDEHAQRSGAQSSAKEPTTLDQRAARESKPAKANMFTAMPQINSLGKGDTGESGGKSL